MKDTDLYQQVLGLDKPWQVGEVNLELAAKRVTVIIKCDRGVRWGDPGDGSRAHLHGWTKRQWRHLDTCQFETVLEAEVPSVKYADGRVEEVAVPWAERYSRVSKLMEAFVIRVLQAASSLQEAATLFARGHKYATVLNDLSGSRVWKVVGGRKQVDADGVWDSLTQEQCEGVQAIAMDMWTAFENSAGEALPNAKIVHDQFHVSKHLNEAVDKVRKAEHRKLIAEGDDTLKGSKYDWLRNHPDIRKAESASFRELHKINLKTIRAWQLKETFSGFWDYSYARAAEKSFKQWYNKAIRSQLEPVKAVARMLKTHHPELLNYLSHRITNAMSEGFNSLIKGTAQLCQLPNPYPVLLRQARHDACLIKTPAFCPKNLFLESRTLEIEL